MTPKIFIDNWNRLGMHVAMFMSSVSSNLFHWNVNHQML